MAGCVDQVELVLDAAGTGIAEQHCLSFDGDAAPAPGPWCRAPALACRAADRPGPLEQPVCQVDLPWSMWAMMQKLRMRATSLTPGTVDGGATTPALLLSGSAPNRVPATRFDA